MNKDNTTNQTAKHTPGPWRAEINVNSLELEVVSGSDNTIAVIDGYDEANARLIAAAPELLEAAIQMCENIGNGIYDEMTAYDKLKTAITKATGGTL